MHWQCTLPAPVGEHLAGTEPPNPLSSQTVRYAVSIVGILPVTDMLTRYPYFRECQIVDVHRGWQKLTHDSMEASQPGRHCIQSES